MKPQRLDPLREMCDSILIDSLPAALTETVRRLHRKGMRQRSLAHLIRSVGGTKIIVAACEALWERLDRERLHGI